MPAHGHLAGEAPRLEIKLEDLLDPGLCASCQDRPGAVERAKEADNARKKPKKGTRHFRFSQKCSRSSSACHASRSAKGMSRGSGVAARDSARERGARSPSWASTTSICFAKRSNRSLSRALGTV